MAGRSKKGRPLSASQYQSILQNPVYYGVFSYNGESYEGTHEPIITKKLFDQCQEVMARRGKPKKVERQFVLRGLMRCGECGRMITAELQKGHTYYRCTKRLTNCNQKYVREEEFATQIQSILQKVSLCDDWTTKILKELYKDKALDVQSSRPQQQNLQDKIIDIDRKINRLIDVYLEGNIALEEYQRKKETYLNEKKDLQERLKDFAAGGDNWFERAKDFVTDLNRVSYVLRDGNLESQREILEKIGSNFILKERRLNFSSEGTFRHYLSSAPYQNWRTQSLPIRTAAEISADIKLLFVQPLPLYQKIAQKAIELRLLGMTYSQIAKALNISKKTVRKACKYIPSPRRGEGQGEGV